MIDFVLLMGAGLVIGSVAAACLVAYGIPALLGSLFGLSVALFTLIVSER